jgi:geranylgeranyl diphosphate synthase type I
MMAVKRQPAVDLEALYQYLPALERELRQQYAEARRGAPPVLRPYVDVNHEFTLRGGKRFRAILVLAGYHLATGRAPRPALPAAAGLEHFQSWMLIHDDIIDHSEERRGGPAVHRSLTAEHRASGREGSSEEYGVGIGITLGDLEEPFTVEAILKTTAPPAARLAALAEYVRMTRLTAYGQLLDIRNGTLPPADVSERDVLDVHRLKSAIYTVVSPLRIGALLGGSRPAALTDLEAAGTDLGIAFQLRDDVLGAGFDADESGKSANDLVEGKRTLLVVRAWAKGSAEDRARLLRVLGNPQAVPEDVERAREVLRSTGSLDYSERRIHRPVARPTRPQPPDPGARETALARGRGPVGPSPVLTRGISRGTGTRHRSHRSGGGVRVPGMDRDRDRLDRCRVHDGRLRAPGGPRVAIEAGRGDLGDHVHRFHGRDARVADVRSADRFLARDLGERGDGRPHGDDPDAQVEVGARPR